MCEQEFAEGSGELFRQVPLISKHFCCKYRNIFIFFLRAHVVSEHGLTMNDYEELKKVETSLKSRVVKDDTQDRLKSRVDLNDAPYEAKAAPSIQYELSAQNRDESQDKQQCSAPMDNIKEVPRDSAVGGTNNDSQPTASTMDNYVEGNEKSHNPLTLCLDNKCRFRCDKCEESFGSWRELRGHVGKVHGQRYVKCNFNEYAMVKVYSNCFECKAKVLQDYDAIRLHMVTHGIKNLEDYKKADNEKEVEKVDSNTASHEKLKNDANLEDAGKIACGTEYQVMQDESTENEIGKETSSSAPFLSIRLRDVIMG